MTFAFTGSKFFSPGELARRLGVERPNCEVSQERRRVLQILSQCVPIVKLLKKEGELSKLSLSVCLYQFQRPPSSPFDFSLLPVVFFSTPSIPNCELFSDTLARLPTLLPPMLGGYAWHIVYARALTGTLIILGHVNEYTGTARQ